MPASTLKSYNTFVKGIITEAGPLTFPEDASIDMENVVLGRDGAVQRRLGMDFEPEFVLRPASINSATALTAHAWEGVASNADLNFVVAQVGKRLHIYTAGGPSTSAGMIVDFDATSILDGSTSVQTASGAGYLFFVDGRADPHYLQYNPGTGVISAHKIDTWVRDVWGIPDSLAVQTRPTSLSTEHNYNLRNQGWPPARVTEYHSAQGVYPSNAQQWFLGRKDDNSFDPDQLDAMEFGSTPAPKGSNVLGLYDRSGWRNLLTSLTTPTDQDFTRPSTVAFAFQRLWLAGMQSPTPLPIDTSPNLTGMVLYSRTVRGPKDFGQFYSDADPTSEVDSELVDTDGGFVMIPDSGKIHKLLSIGSSIVVLAEHGVWEIRGDQGGFTATSHQVIKVSSVGAVGPAAVVQAEGHAFYWNKGGIYLLSQNDMGFLVSTNITENSIQSLYNSLDLATKKNAVGTYDPANKRASWMYNDDTAYTGVTFKNRYNKELVLDLALESWTKHSISAHSEPSPYIAGYVQMPDFVLRKEGVRSRGDSVTKYLTVQFVDPDTNAAGVTFSYYRDETFRDWKSSDGAGTGFLSYMVCGHEIMGDTSRAKQAPYIVVHCKRTEMYGVVGEDGEAVANNPSGLFMQARWDWSDSGTSGKWGNPQQVYRIARPYGVEIGKDIDYGFSVVTTKNRVRGSGKALSMYYYSDGDKDFYLHGWATKFTGKQHV
jgi:hypothetical protein